MITAQADSTLQDLLEQLWSSDPPDENGLDAILPRRVESLAGFRDRLADWIQSVPRRVEGTVDPAAIVRGEIVSMGPGSRIDPGAIIDESCRLVLGARSVIRSGTILRDEVVVGEDSMIGAHCEAARTVIRGPHSYFGHYVYLGDTIVGRDANVSAYCGFANTKLRKGAEISIRHGSERVMTGRTSFGALIGDGVRLGAQTVLCPGTVVAPGVELPPSVVLLGVIDRERAGRMMDDFFTKWEPRN